MVFQESRSSVLDFITRFDYDGDWRGDNNWRNAYLFDLPGYVYYSVIESSRHYFITYAFYHPRDYTARPYEGFAPKTEHENDLEGCTVTVEKDGTRVRQGRSCWRRWRTTCSSSTTTARRAGSAPGP